MKAVVVSALLALSPLAIACANNPTPPPVPASSSATPAAPTAAAESFGAPISEGTPFVALGELLESPEKFDGKQVRTRGEIVAVCQNAGCWCDLRDPDSKTAAVAPPVHVTMHGHAFFLPKDAKTKLADLEGTIAVRTLTQAEVDHFNGEGASLVAGSPVLAVDALGVALHAP